VLEIRPTGTVVIDVDALPGLVVESGENKELKNDCPESKSEPRSLMKRRFGKAVIWAIAVGVTGFRKSEIKIDSDHLKGSEAKHKRKRNSTRARLYQCRSNMLFISKGGIRAIHILVQPTPYCPTT
jgi:hypothetical protein